MKQKITFDRSTSQFSGLTSEVLKDLYDRFPCVDVDHELNRMCDWLLSDKGKKRAGTLSFIESWLSRAPVSKKRLDEILPDELKSHLMKYLAELWKTTNITRINQK